MSHCHGRLGSGSGLSVRRLMGNTERSTAGFGDGPPRRAGWDGLDGSRTGQHRMPWTSTEVCSGTSVTSFRLATVCCLADLREDRYGSQFGLETYQVRPNRRTYLSCMSSSHPLGQSLILTLVSIEKGCFRRLLLTLFRLSPFRTRERQAHISGVLVVRIMNAALDYLRYLLPPIRTSHR